MIKKNFLKNPHIIVNNRSLSKPIRLNRRRRKKRKDLIQYFFIERAADDTSTERVENQTKLWDLGLTDFNVENKSKIFNDSAKA